MTDAAVVLGWLAPEDYLGGEVRIVPELAAQAMDDVARPLGLSLEAAAFGIIRVANAMLVQSIRALAVERGLDVRPMALMPFGGAGPLYGGMIARELGMREVIVPRHPGRVRCGGAAGRRHPAHGAGAIPRGADGLDVGAFATAAHRCAPRWNMSLPPTASRPERRSFRVLGDLRYIGQFHEIVCEMPPTWLQRYDAAALSELFHQQHVAHYGHADPKAPVEIVNLRVEATGGSIRRPSPTRRSARSGPPRAAPHPRGGDGAHRPLAMCRSTTARRSPKANRLRGPPSSCSAIPRPSCWRASGAGRRRRHAPHQGGQAMNIDSVSRDVFQHEAVSVAEEMSAALRRSAFSAIIWDMIDYACGLLDPDGNTIAQAPTIPAQLGIMPTAFRHMIREIPLAEWHEGDVIICNDPYLGCTHTPDIVLFSPVIFEGELIAIASTVAHHIDVGGRVPGSSRPPRARSSRRACAFRRSSCSRGAGRTTRSSGSLRATSATRRHRRATSTRRSPPAARPNAA